MKFKSRIPAFFLALLLALSICLALALPVSALTQPQVTLSSYVAGENAQYTITFTTGVAGYGGNEWIAVQFPEGTSIDAVPTCTVFIDGVEDADATITTDESEITVWPTIIDKEATCEITFTSGITNPTTAGNKTLNVFTTVEMPPVQSATYTLVPGPVHHLGLNAPAHIIAGGSPAAYSVTRYDQHDNPVTVGELTVYLHSSSNGANSEFRYPEDTAVTSVSFTPGASSHNFWYYDEKSGNWSITASDNDGGPDGAAGLGDATDVLTVNPAAFNAGQSTLTVDETTRTAGQSVAVTVTPKDQYGNQLLPGQAVAVLLDGSGQDCDGDITVTYAGSGTYTADVKVTGVDADNIISATVGGSSVTQTRDITVSPGETAKFGLNNPDNLVAGDRAAYTVTRMDAYNNPVVSGALTVYLYVASHGGNYFMDAAEGGNQITQVAIADTQSSADFWYRDTTPGNWTITVSDNAAAADGNEGIDDASDVLTVVAGELDHFSLSHPADIVAGARAGYIVFRQDVQGNLISTGNDTVYLYSDSTGDSAFYDAAAGGNVITSITITAGNESANFWYYDEKAGDWNVTASDNNLAPDGDTNINDVSDSITVSPGAAHHFTIEGDAAMTAGGTNNLTIRAYDQYDNLCDTGANNYDGIKNLTFSGASNALSGTHPTVSDTNFGTATAVTFVNGVAANVTAKLYRAETATIKASSGGVTTPTGLEVTVSPAAASHLYYITMPGAMTAGGESTWSVQRRDQYNNLVLAGDLTVNLASNSTGPNKAFRAAPAGPEIYTLTITNGTSGKGFFYYDELAGTWTITASSDGLDPVSREVTFSPAVVAKLVYKAHPNSTTAGVETVTAFTVQRQDAFGNEIKTGETIVTMTSTSDGAAKEFRAESGGGSVDTVTIAEGVSAVNFYYYDEKAGSWDITISSGVLTTDVHTITVNPAAAHNLAVTTQGAGTETAGTAFTVTLTVRDQYHNTCNFDTDDVNVDFWSTATSAPDGETNPTIPSPQVVDFEDGVGSAAGFILVDAAETPLIIAEGAVGSALAGIDGDSGNITVNPGPAVDFSISGDTDTITAGGFLLLTITALDTYGNTDTAYDGDKTLTFSGASDAWRPHVTAKPCITNANSILQYMGDDVVIVFTEGVAVGTSGAGVGGKLYLYKAETAEMTAADVANGVTTPAGQEFAITVNAGAASMFYINPWSTSMNAGTEKTLTINATDQFGNHDPDYDGDKTLTFAGLAAAVTGEAATFNGVDIGEGTAVTFDQGTGDVTLVAYKVEVVSVDVSDGTIDSTGSESYDCDLTVNAGALSGFTIGAVATQNAGVAFDIAINAMDQYGNLKTGYVGTVSLSDTSGTIAPAVTGDFVAGERTESVTVFKLGGQAANVITVTDSIDDTLTGSSNAFNVAGFKIVNTDKQQGYLTIQAAVNGADPGDTIEVAAGTYNEAVLIDKDLTLQSAAGAAATSTLQVTITQDCDVTLDGFAITGSADNGIIFPNGIAAGQTVTIQNCVIHGHVENGIKTEAAIDGTLNVLDNIIGQNGMNGILLFNHKITGTLNVTGNAIGEYVEEGVWDLSGNGGSGLSLEGANCGITATGSMLIENNTMNGNSDTNIYVSAMEGGSELVIRGNTVTDCGDLGGIFLYDLEDDSTVTVEGNTISGNTSAGSDVAGITLNSVFGDMTIRGNTVSGNNFGIHIFNGALGASTQLEITHNSFLGNTVYGIKNDDTTAVDAGGNWWGAVTGPRHATANLSSPGDDVTDYVLYSPWLDAAYPEGASRAYNVINTTQSTTYDDIQIAVDDADSGDTLQVAPGTYTAFSIDTDLTVTAPAGPAVTKINSSGVYAVGISGAYDITLDGFDVDGVDAVHGISVANGVASGKTVTIQNCVINQNTGNGIYVIPTGAGPMGGNIIGTLRVIDNIISQNTLAGINTGIVQGTLLVRGNTIGAVDDGAWDLAGNTGAGIFIMSVDDAGHADIEENIITANGDNGIRVGAVGAAPDTLNITCNDISGNTGNGIRLGMVWDSTAGITGNDISGNTECGIYVNRVDNSLLNMEDNEITGNGTSGEYDGICVNVVDTGSTLTIEGNVVSDATWSGIGIGDITDASEVNITGNLASGNESIGVEIDIAISSTVDITDNTVTGNEGAGIGIGDVTLSEVSIQDNEVRDNHYVGIWVNEIDDAPDTVIIKGNTVTGHQDITDGEGITGGILNMGIFNSTLEISYNTLEENAIGVHFMDVISLDEGSALIVTNNNFVDNINFGLNNKADVDPLGEYDIDATNNWWGSASGPTHADNADGTGDAVSDHVLYDQWRTSAAVWPIPAPPPPPAPGPGPAPDPTPDPAPKVDISFDDVESSVVVNEGGSAQNSFSATTSDGNLTLTIEEGTELRDSGGNTLERITVEPFRDNPPPAPSNTNVIGIPYDFGPDGATFDPPLTITLAYDPDNLPEGAVEEELVIAYYDETTGEWIDLECTVDTENHTVTACVPHFTTYAVLARVVETGPGPTETPTTPTPTKPAPTQPTEPTTTPTQTAPATTTTATTTQPAPQDEAGGFPWWAILLIVLAAAAAACGGWMYWKQRRA